MNSTERVKLYRLNQAKQKRTKKDYYLTESEHEQLKIKLKQIRGEKNEL